MSPLRKQVFGEIRENIMFLIVGISGINISVHSCNLWTIYFLECTHLTLQKANWLNDDEPNHETNIDTHAEDG